MNVLITGTSSGIGNGLAKEFLLRNMNVYGTSRRQAKKLDKHDNYSHLAIDLTDYEKVKNNIPVWLNDVKSFDLVVLNAGILGEIKWMSEMDVTGMKKVMDINVWANKVLLDLLFEMGINIRQVVGMSSKASLRSSPGWGPYSMSKAGLNMLMNIYSNERPETKFYAFAPGLVDSEIQDDIYSRKETDKYPSLKKLQNARYTDSMPDAIKAAPTLIEGMEKALQYESGTFLDVREM